jgi:hypothetical protein
VCFVIKGKVFIINFNNGRPSCANKSDIFEHPSSFASAVRLTPEAADIMSKFINLYLQALNRNVAAESQSFALNVHVCS